MDQKASGIERFLAPSLNRIEDELKSIHSEINQVNVRIDTVDNRLTKIEENHSRITTKIDKTDNGLTTEAQVLFDSINEMEKRNRDEIDILKRVMDSAHRKIVILEAKMKELGQ
jgi:predicted  nucleic acid-binding Zn-ribbon protein